MSDDLRPPGGLELVGAEVVTAEEQATVLPVIVAVQPTNNKLLCFRL